MGRINCLSHGFTHFEMGNAFFGNHDLLARAGIAAQSGRTPADRKAPEAANFDTVLLSQGIGYRLKDGAHRQLGIFVRELVEAFGQSLDQVTPCHVDKTDQLLSSLARSRAPKLVVPALF